MNPNLKKLSEKALSLPLSPGVYIMKGEGDKIIYIGKARELKNRVSQYFREAGHESPKVQSMVDHVIDFDYIVCTGEFEALILEASLIKQHTPKYNILLKDDKGYHYIRISDDKWRNITAEKMIKNDGAKYLGPYNSGMVVNQTVETAKNIFTLPKCNKNFDGKTSSRPCLNHAIGLCCAPCAKKVSLAEYNELVDGAIRFIKVGSKEILDDLTKKMYDAAENMQFERAAKLRDRINSIKKAGEKQKIVSSSVKEQDVFGFAFTPEKICVEVFHFADGRLYDDEHFLLDGLPDTSETKEDFILSYYSGDRNIPKQITLDENLSNAPLIARYLSDKSGKTVKVAVPQKGEQFALVKMCQNNASERLILSKGQGKRGLAVLDELAMLLGLSKTPKYIEAYDISHTAGDENVAGMVVFKDGKPFKKAYKRFKIRGFDGQDDYGSMAEVLERRISEYNQNKSSDEGFGILPDLILLDGGKGQISAVLPKMTGDFASVPIFGMVKNSHHKTDSMVGIQGEIEIKQTRNVFTLITRIQDEVHRYALDYHRLRRKNSLFNSQLTSVEGIGEKRAKLLTIKFGSVENISKLSVEQLKSCQGMTEKSAQNVWNFFHKDDE